MLGHKLPERYLVTFFMKGKEGDEVQSIEPSAATWGRVINPSTNQCQRLPKQIGEDDDELRGRLS